MGMAMNDEKRNGPEFAPIRNYNTKLLIVVNIYDNKDKLIRTEQMDYGNPEDRKWLGKLSYWAWTHGNTVETVAEEANSQST